MFPEDYDYLPMTYIFPEDYKRFLKDREENPKLLWIMKPVSSSRGRGIKMISRKSKVSCKPFHYLEIF